MTAAAHFGVSVSFVVNLVKAFRMRGSLAPKPQPMELETDRQISASGL
jgi:transposase